ncbi:hypothetical protein ABB37_07868 [Leptomonas pyrrhocoris]|uniref:Uncharacterized protein n=1 Tax=Leptomonas pyrrhocoris TaxID=157538 RepID=A0A0M9FU17_LEPPY|nr:hypothetical protein ABB37_07868 [Leptomonas pyrrhocoris]XP_015654530.1 hypothetical protein ABB37_07868 [Leptomonas pyrrhocoris]KPA76090.1 hypothetical protein ABB37_07868 [Leptomonas pyrrhocoris]KPA76091.1 hypothetical protein ABB37_07868 [Leptomonas pyrrhocoris]|eukprot:XP_015654529.1 hypothetical protein ABB37_07868 [Leptomonas pyrrhocoris]
MLHTSSGSRRRLHQIVLSALLVLLCCLSHVTGAADVALDEAAVVATERPFNLTSASTLLELLAEPSPASPQATQPVLILFTDESVEVDVVDAVRHKVRQLATDIPPAVLRVHEFRVPAAVTERRLVDLVLNGLATRLPSLVLFHSSVHKAQVIPGSFVAAAPLSVPLPYPKQAELGSVSYMELRTWVLSEMPVRYVDPVTFHVVPSLQFVFRPEEAVETLRLVQRAAEDDGEGRSVLPAAVSMAYLRLTTHGSEEVVAALSSLATQAGNAALTLVTESAEVAAAWGLAQEHTLSTAPWAAVAEAYLCGRSGTASRAENVVVVGAEAAQPVGTIAEVVEATAAAPLWRTAAATTGAAQQSQLRAWRRAMENFNATSPLRKIDTAAHLLHELVALQQAIKIVFVLRESDEMWFPHHLDVAVRLAGQLRQTSLFYNTTTLVGNAKVPTRAVRSWSPSARMEVFWLDAEQLPAVAGGLFVTQVPAVLVVAPLQSRFQDGGEAEEGEGEEEKERAGLRSIDPFLGIHTVNRYDLFTAAFTNDASAAVDPPTGKAALPQFPSDSNALVRFLASGSFLGAVQFALHPMRLSQLRASILSEVATTTTTGASTSPDGGPSSSSASTLPNKRYAQLDYRYYPLRPAEEPMEGPAYVRQILNGSSPLPVVTDAARGRSNAHPRRGAKAGAAAAAAVTDTKAAAAAAQQKAAWEAELARRQRERAARVAQKAATDAAARAREKTAFQQSVEAAIRAEAEADGKLRSTVGGMEAGATRTAGGLLVRRPSLEAAAREETAATSYPPSSSHGDGMESEDAEDAAQRVRRRRRYAEYKEWQADRGRMADGCVSVKNGQELLLRFQWI